MPASPNRSPAQPLAVLFACGLNAIRSPMAAAMLRQMLGSSIYVGSAGVAPTKPGKIFCQFEMFNAPGLLVLMERFTDASIGSFEKKPFATRLR